MDLGILSSLIASVVAMTLALLIGVWRIVAHQSAHMDGKIERLSDQIGGMRERMARMEGYLMAQQPTPAQAAAENG